MEGWGFGVRGSGLIRGGEFGFVSSKKSCAGETKNRVFKAPEGMWGLFGGFGWLRFDPRMGRRARAEKSFKVKSQDELVAAFVNFRGENAEKNRGKSGVEPG